MPAREPSTEQIFSRRAGSQTALTAGRLWACRSPPGGHTRACTSATRCATGRHLIIAAYGWPRQVLIAPRFGGDLLVVAPSLSALHVPL